MITGKTRVIAHLGLPTDAFKAPMIYNPYFETRGIDVVVVPMGCPADTYPEFLRLLFKLRNLVGALVTMPHKVTTVGLVDEVSPMAEIAGACNAVKGAADGRLVGDLFDGEGFVRGARGNGCTVAGAGALVIGTGGAGSAIAASLARAGVARLGLFDLRSEAAEALAHRLGKHFPDLDLVVGVNDPAGWAIVVNATPLGMQPGDPLPTDPMRLAPETFVGEVVMGAEQTPFLAAARARGCRTQSGLDMLFAQIPAYLAFFGLPTTTADDLRALARLT